MYSAAPVDIRFEHGPTLGIGAASPRLSWAVPDAEPDFTQDAYEVEVTRDGTDVVSVESGEQVLVPWPVAPLASRERATVRLPRRRSRGGNGARPRGGGAKGRPSSGRRTGAPRR